MICVSIAPKTMKEAVLLLKELEKYKVLVELRVENILYLNLAKLLNRQRPPVIISCRPSPKYFNLSVLSILHQAIELGAEYVDIDFKEGAAAINEIIKHAQVIPYLKKIDIANWQAKLDSVIREDIQHPTKVILSYHDFKTTPKNLYKIYTNLKQFRADIFKIAVTANDISDNIRIFQLLKKARNECVKLIAFCMGQKGEISRILAPKFGGFLTYCTIKEGKETAEGQIPFSKLLNVYNYGSINAKTKIFGLVGNPVSHSKGIYVYNEFFKKKKLNAVYLNFLVQDYKKFIHSFKPFIDGFSVTIPFKNTAAITANALSSEAKQTMAVNTVVKKSGKLIGMNTDVVALVELLKNMPNGLKTVIYGAGGSARSAIVASQLKGWKVTIVGRNIDIVKKLAKEFKCEFDSRKIINHGRFDVFINATPVGMYPNSNKQILSEKILRKDMLIIDFVYTPTETKLIMAARKKECNIISGIEIFTKQAEMQQKIFMSVI